MRQWYVHGEMLYYTGANQTFDNGDRLVHGEQGEVMGPGTGQWEDRLEIKFPNNKGNIACTLNVVTLSAAAAWRLQARRDALLHRSKPVVR